MGGQQSRRRSKSRNSVTSIADIAGGGDDFEQRSRAATEVVPSGGAVPAETAKHGRSKSLTKAKSKDTKKEKKGSKSNIVTSPSTAASVASAGGVATGVDGVGEDSNIARPDDIKVRFAEEKSSSRASAAVTSPASAISPTSAISATSAPSPSPSQSADGIPTSSLSPPPGDREPEGDREEVIFDVPELDEESLFAFAHGMQLTCAGDGQIPKLPNLKAVQASVKGMDLIRKIKFRQTGDDTISRDDLIAPVTALFVALSMEKAKITDFDIAGVPAATNLVKQLAAAIKANRPLYSLGVHLSRTALSTTVAAVANEVCSALQFNTKLVSLDLSFTPLGPQDGAILADLINYNTSLMSLSLKKCRLGVCGPNIAVMMQSNTSLTELDLTGNEMGDVGGRAIAGALVANQTLLRLWLDENNLTAVTVQDLAKSLSINRTLTSLSLRENDLNVSGGSAISTILRMNSTLKHLDLNGCNLGILGAKWIAKSLEANKSLTSLHVAYNDLAYDGAVEILKSLRANIKLSCLDITGNKIGARGEKTVRSLIKANKKITTLLAAHNQFSDKFYAKLYEKLEENSDNRIGLSVKPRTLSFPIQFGRMVDFKTHFFITNTSDNWLCFSVSSNAEHVQGLYPSTGFLKPRATVAIIVQLNGRFHAEYCRHVILLRTSTIRKAEHLKRPPREYWRVTKTSKEKHHACTYIRCEFTAPDDRQEWSPMQVEEGDPLYLTVRQAEQRRSTTANRWMTLAGDKKRPMGAIAVDSEELVALRREVERLRGLLDQYRRKGRGGDGEGGIGGNGDGTFDVSNIFGGGGAGDSDSDGEGLLDDDGEEVDTLMSARRRKLRRERKRREGDDDDGLDLLDSDMELDSDDDFGDGGGGGGGKRGRGRGGKGKGGGKGDGYGSGSGDEDGLGGGGSKKKGGAGAGADLASELALKKRSSTELEKPPEEMVVGAGPDAPPMAPPMGDIPMAPGMGPVGPPPKKSRYKPTVPMRKFYWQVIMPLNVEETLWRDVDDYPIDLDQPEFETYFAVKAIEKKVKEKTEEEMAAEEEKKRLEAEKVRFIDAKRAFNLEVTLSRFKISYESIRDAMLTMDQTVLTEEKIETLLKFAPTDQELKDVTSYKGDPSKLGNSEQFFRCIAVIPRIRNRLELFLFRLQFPEAMDTIEGELKMVEDALEQVKSSIHLRTILTIILAFGNFMNHGTKNGGAFGYHLSTLGKLRDIRSTDNKSTLLHYLVTYVQKNKPSAGNFVKELTGVKMASKVEASNMVYQVGKVTKFCNKLKSELDLFKDEASRGIRRDGDQFIHTMDAFFENSIGRIKSLSQRQAKADSQINELIRLYGGDPKIMKWEQFFGFFDNFTSDYQATEQFLEAVRLREEADARKAIADAQRKQETAIKKAAKKAAYEEKKREREAAEARGELLPDSEYSSPVVTPRERAVAFVEDNENGNENQVQGQGEGEDGGSQPGSEQSVQHKQPQQQHGEASPTSPGTGDDEDEEDWG